MVRKLLMIGGAVALCSGCCSMPSSPGSSWAPPAMQPCMPSSGLCQRSPGRSEVGGLQGSFFSSLVMRDIVLKDEQGRVIANRCAPAVL